jgi:hypothetical protein
MLRAARLPGAVLLGLDVVAALGNSVLLAALGVPAPVPQAD